jgi:hypothetical protein
MLGTRHLLTTLMLSAVLTAEPAPQPTPLEDDLVAYSELVENSAQYLGKTVRFAFSFESVVETWNPYLTRFGTRQWTCAQGWSDEKFPWLAQDFATPEIRIFLRKDSRAARRVIAAQSYYRYEVVGIVREFLGGRPWIEVTRLDPLDSRLTEGTVIHAERAIREMEEEKFTLAIENLERARVGKLPRRAARELESLLEESRAKLTSPADEL